MKKITAFFILVILLSFVSCDTVTHYTMKVSVDRNPALIIENRTGYPVVVTAPAPSSINNGASSLIQPAETRGTINVSYMIGRVPFTEQVTMNNADVTVTLTKRPPTIIVVNRTGQSVILTAPESLNMDNGERRDFLATPNQLNNITYQIGRMKFTEQVTMRNEDVTVNLTKKPATITIVNNVGAAVNLIRVRSTGNPTWIGGNLDVNKNGTINRLVDIAQAGNVQDSIMNGDRINLYLGNVDFDLTGNTLEIRLTDVRQNDYIKRNVQVTNDITLTFTAADRN